MTTTIRLNSIRRSCQAARTAYHVTHSDAARKCLKRALRAYLLAGGTVYASTVTTLAEAGD